MSPRRWPPLFPPRRASPEEEEPEEWAWLPPLSTGGEVAVRLLLGAAAASVAFLGVGLALGTLPRLVSSDGLGMGARLFVGAVGGVFACAALSAWLDMPLGPLARGRKAAEAWIHRALVAFTLTAAASAAALALGWLT